MCGKKMEYLKANYEKSWFCLFIIFLICVVTIGLPVFIAGFPDGSDEITHLRFALAYRDAFSTGNILPAWMMDNFGFGGVGVRFYPPFVYLTTACLEVILGSW